MLSEGIRVSIFAIVIMVFPFFLAATLCREESAADAKVKPGARDPGWDDYPVGRWAAFALAWGALWALFPQMRSARAQVGIWPQVWDGYGAMLWAGGFAAAAWLARAGRTVDYLHLALLSGFLASAYGVLQYFNVEFIWPSILNPYGGRSVSTFGNPNFLSSFNVVLLPLAAALFLHARSLSRRLIYGALFLALGTAILASLTRSSWGGAVTGLALLLLSKDIRARVAEEPRAAGLLAGLTVMIVAFWPESRIAGSYHPSVVGRLVEIKTFSQADGYYSPFHQRLLIWTCSWLMGAENPVTGKGWGLFELFYPFYQGHILDAISFFRTMRTHANNSHNEIMEIWAQTGILGLGAMLWLWATFFRNFAPGWKAVRGMRSTLGLAAACGVGCSRTTSSTSASTSPCRASCSGGPLERRRVQSTLRTGPGGPPGPPPGQAAAWASGAPARDLLVLGLHLVPRSALLRRVQDPARRVGRGRGQGAERSKSWGPRGQLDLRARQRLRPLERFADADRAHADLEGQRGLRRYTSTSGPSRVSRLGAPNWGVLLERLHQPPHGHLHGLAPLPARLALHRSTRPTACSPAPSRSSPTTPTTGTTWASS